MNPSMPPRRDEPILVIADGGIAAMTATLMARPAPVIFWTPPLGARLIDCDTGRLAAAHVEAARAEAEALGARGFVTSGSCAWPGSGGEIPDAAMLLLACEAAARAGCSRVVWPVVHGGDPDRIYEAEETASLVARLFPLAARGGSRGESPAIELPFVDLSPEQVVDLARDAQVPMDMCWWRRAPRGDPTADAARWTWEASLCR
jgi:hypothetical protein